VTLSATAPSKAVSLDAGDDSLTLATGTTTATANLSGGDGTDTLVMAAADAASASSTDSFQTKFDGFEKLSLGIVADGASNSVSLLNMDNISYVASAGTAMVTAEVQTLTITGTASGAVSFLGTAIASSASGDTASATATRITADKTALIAAWNAANPTKELSNISNSGATITLTYATTEGDVVNVASATSAGITFPTSAEATKGVLANGALTITKMANAGTMELTAVGSGATVTMTDATGTADSLNVLVKNTAGINAGTVTAAGVESINLTVTDTTTTAIGTHTLSLADAALKTVVVTGNAGLTLTTNSAVLTSVDGSALTAALTATTNGTVAQTILGGAGADSLTAAGTSDVLNGGAGADTLTATGDLASLTGGAGADVFNVADATTNVNSYATIVDLAAGDTIKFYNTGVTESFASAKIVLGDTAVFQDYANAAISANDGGAISWFQYSGNTYVIEHISSDASTSFVNGSDVVVKIAGLIDLSTASFSSSTQTLVIV
jgi:S-layer protein